jgi:molecular chaperone DnaK (HSP70)
MNQQQQQLISLFSESEKNALFFDLGGNAFDALLLEIDSRMFEIRSIADDNHLGR